MAELVVSVPVAAPPSATWSYLTDWDRHDDWMVATRAAVTATGLDGAPVAIEAVTGIGPLSFRDPMTITRWQPPHRCVVTHTGRVVRGAGAFEVEETPDGGSRVVWSEWVRLPLGLLGEIGWLAVRPLAAGFLRLSLRRLARAVEAAPGAQAAPDAVR